MTDPYGGSFGDPGSNPFAQGGGAVRSATVNLGANTGSYQQSMGQASSATAQLNTQVGNLIGRVDQLFKSGGRSLKLFGAADAASLTAGVASVAQLQAQMSSLNATATVNRTSMKAYGRDVDDVFSKFDSHRGDVVALVNEITNLGAKGRDVESLASTFTKLGRASGEGIPQLTQDLMLLSRQMGNTQASQIAGYANAVLTVSKNAGVSATSVLQFSQSIAPIARQAKISEAAVLDISTAFTKAGADGFVAANTFNSIVNDITTLTRTGSPQLVKYSSFLGETVAQFRKMPAKDQITGIFDAIAKGGPKALNFVQELGLGTRALSAVQAVAQTGGLGSTVAQANSGNTHNLDRASSVAMSGLESEGAKVRNQLTRFADLVSGPLLTPLTGLAHGLDIFLTIVNKVVGALGPLPAIVGVVVAALAPLAGIALSHAGLVMGGAAVRSIFGANSAPRQAYREGQAASAMGGTREEAMAAGRTYGPMVAAGAAPMRISAAYRLGYSRGMPGEPVPGEPGMGRLGFFGAMRAGFRLPRAYLDSNTRLLDDSALPGSARSGTPQPDGAGGYTTRPGFMARMRTFAVDTRGAATETGVGGTLAREGAGLGGSLLRYGGATIGAAGSMAMSGLGRVGSMAGTLGRAAFSMPGMLALMAGVPLLGALGGKMGEHTANASNVDGAYNAITKYDNLLGQTSSNLAQFNSAVQSAGDKLNNLGGRPLGAVAHITPADVAAATSGYKITDTNLRDIKRNHGGVAGSVGYIQTLAMQKGGMNPALMDAIKKDLIASYGPGSAVPQQILDQYMSTSLGPNGMPTINYGALGSTARGLNNDRFKNIVGQGVSAIDSQTTVGGGPQASRAKIAALARLVGSGLVGTKYGENDNLVSARKMLAEALGGKGTSASQLNTLTGTDTAGTNLPNSFYSKNYGTASAGQASVLRAIINSSVGKKALQGAGVNIDALIKSTGGDWSKLIPAVQSQLGGGFPGSSNSASGQALAGSGALGRYISGNRLFAKATTGDQSGDPTTGERALVATTDKASKLSGGLTAASGALMRLSDTMGGAATPTGALIASASAWARQLASFRTPYMSRAGQLGQAAATLEQSRKAYLAPNASAATISQYHQDQQAYEQQKASYQQYMISVEQSANQFGRTMERSNEDYHTSVLRSERNFGIQMEQANEDYQKSIYRSTRNFNLSKLRGEQDYNKQRARSMEDFNIQMARSAQSAAESIYDPFSRVQSQSVVNGGMLASNLKDENDRIQKQNEQVRKLRASGLSQQAIDTLQLNDPKNAQQTNSIANSVINDPKTIKHINELIATRQKATTALTQSQYNEQFRNTVADFNRGLNRTSADFHQSEQRAAEDQRTSLHDMATDFQTSQRRAVESQALSLSDMSTDFHKMVKRSTQDLKTQMTELYGSFASVYADTLGAINKKIAKYSPAIARDLIAQIVAAKRDIAGAAGADSSGGGGGGSVGKVGSASNPVVSAGTMGVAPNGQVGSYDSKGNFHVQDTRGLPPSYVSHLPHIANPKYAGHQQAQTPEGAKKYASSQLAKYGWSQSQMAPLIKLWNNESGWRYTAYNASSGATGIPQALPGNKMASAGPDWKTNGATQIDWGLGYIAQRYGSPSEAAAFEFSHDPHWYAAGGIFKGPKVIGVGEKGPEAALPLNPKGADFMVGFYDQVTARLASRMHTRGMGISGMAGGGQTVYHQVHDDNRTFYTGDVVVQAESAAQMEAKLVARQRLKRLAHPAHA